MLLNRWYHSAFPCFIVLVCCFLIIINTVYNLTANFFRNIHSAPQWEAHKTPARSLKKQTKAQLISPGENISSDEEQSETRKQESWDLHSTRCQINICVMLREKFPRNVIRRQSPQEDFFVSFFCLFFSYYYFSALSSRSSAAENKVKCGGEGDGDPMVVSSPIPPRPGAHKRRARLWKRWRQNSGSDRNKEPIHRLTSTNSAESEWERKGWREAEGEKEREGGREGGRLANLSIPP